MIYNKDKKTIETGRLLLRLFKQSDAENVSIMCNNYNVYKSTLSLPYPYPIESAITWIAAHEENFACDKSYTFAITLKEDGKLLGCIDISYHKNNRNGEMGYWIGEEHWDNGYATEATKAIIEFAFKEKSYHKVYARHFASNPASGRVMEKCGMKSEGIQKDQIYKNNSYEDIVNYGIVNYDY